MTTTTPTLIQLYRAAKEDADLASLRSCNVNAAIQGAYGRAALAAFPGKTLDEIAPIMEARAYYSDKKLGGGNAESVIVREIIEGRHAPVDWDKVYRAARGNGWSGEVAQRMVRGGFLAYQADGEIYRYTLTDQADAWLIDSMASHKAATAKQEAELKAWRDSFQPAANPDHAVFQGHDAEGLAIYTNVALD